MLQVRNYKSLVLAALLIGAVSTALAGTSCGTNLECEIVGTTLVLTSPDPTQPATIYSQAFKDRTEITDVIFPDNLTEINSAAFQGCTGLTSIVIPPLVTLIGENAFYGCPLTNVLCRPFTAPALGNHGMGEDGNLSIQVPNLNSYREDTSDKHWHEYELTAYSFLDEYDEVSTVTTKISLFRTTNLSSIDIFRTLRKAGCFNTLTLPFSVPDISASPLAGAEVYTFSSAAVEDGTLQLEIEKVTSNSLSAGVPYLIQWDNTGAVLNRMTFTGIAWDDDAEADAAGTGDVNYVGFYGKTHIDDDAGHSNLFLAGNNELYWPSDGDDENAKMLGFRAYFHANTSSALSPVRKGMPASLRIKSTPTDSESPSLQGRWGEATKELRNGQIIIIRNGESYSITGQRL